MTQPHNKTEAGDPLIANFLPYLSYAEAAQAHLRRDAIPHPQLIHMALDFVLLAVPFDPSKVIRIGLPGVCLDKDETKLDFEERVEALMIGSSIPYLERIIAYSPAHRSIVTNRVHGRSLKDIIAHNPALINDIPLDHYEELLGAMRRMADFDLALDNNQDNLFYHPCFGFQIIDYITAGIRRKSEERFYELSIEHMSYDKGAMVASCLENFQAHVLLVLEEEGLLTPRIIAQIERMAPYKKPAY